MKEEKLEDFKPTKWFVPVLREPPTSMTLNPHISLEDIDLSCIGELPEPKLFQVDDVEIVEQRDGFLFQRIRGSLISSISSMALQKEEDECKLESWRGKNKENKYKS